MLYVQHYMKTPKTLKDNTLYLIGEIGKTLRDKVGTAIKKEGYDISPEQFTILVMLFYQDGISQNEISTNLNRDKTTVSRVIGRMITNKLIVKKQVAEDKRENHIFITEKGKVIQEKLIAATGPIYTTALEGIDDKELTIVNTILLKVLNSLK